MIVITTLFYEDAPHWHRFKSSSSERKSKGQLAVGTLVHGDSQNHREDPISAGKRSFC